MVEADNLEVSNYFPAGWMDPDEFMKVPDGSGAFAVFRNVWAKSDSMAAALCAG